MIAPTVFVPRSPAVREFGACARCAAEIADLRARIARLEQEKHILIEQLVRAHQPAAQLDLTLAYAEARFPGCGYEFD